MVAFDDVCSDVERLSPKTTPTCPGIVQKFNGNGHEESGIITSRTILIDQVYMSFFKKVLDAIIS